MFRRFFRACFTFFGALIGYECFALCRYLVTQTDFAGGNAAITKAEETWFAAFFVIIFGVIFFRITPALTRQSRKVADNIGNDLQGISPNEHAGAGNRTCDCIPADENLSGRGKSEDALSDNYDMHVPDFGIFGCGCRQ